MSDTFNELEKKKVLAILGSQRELIQMACCKIYTSGKEGETWLFSDLEGFLCFVLDYSLKTRFFIMYDRVSYETLFQFELYNNFQNDYQSLADDFYCFEFDNGFVGFKFDSINESNMLKLVVNKFNDIFATMLFDMYKNNHATRNINEVSKIYSKILQEKFTGGRLNFDENYIEEGLEIIKPRCFELLNNISYDRDKKEFIIGKIPKEFKHMFKNLGLKKSVFKRPEIALGFFKHFIETLDNIDNKKREKNHSKNINSLELNVFDSDKHNRKNTLNSSISTNSDKYEDKNETNDTDSSTNPSNLNNTHSEKSIEKSLDVINPKPIKIIKCIGLGTELKNILSNISETIPETVREDKPVTIPEDVPETKTIRSNIPSVPSIPSVIPSVSSIPSVPSIPSVIPSVPSKKTSIPSEINNKPPIKTNISIQPKLDTKITKKETNVIQMTLMEAIAQRKKDLEKHYVKEESNDDWSDSDSD